MKESNADERKLNILDYQNRLAQRLRDMYGGAAVEKVLRDVPEPNI